MEGRRSTPDAPQAARRQALVENPDGSVRRCLVNDRGLVDCRAIRLAKRTDGAPGRDGSGRVRQQKPTADLAAPSEGLAREQGQGNDSRSAASERCRSRVLKLQSQAGKARRNLNQSRPSSPASELLPRPRSLRCLTRMVAARAAPWALQRALDGPSTGASPSPSRPMAAIEFRLATGKTEPQRQPSGG